VRRLDCYSALFWLVVSVIVCIQSVRYGLGKFSDPGIGFLFFWCGVALGSFSIILFIKAIQKPKENRKAEEKNPLQEVRWSKICGVLLALVLYGILFEWLGSLLSTVFFIAFLMRVIETKRWITVALVSVVSSVSVYVLFKILLQVRLPEGLLGF
jgi:putative tricarboxylic transport membrane protein